MTIAFWRDEYCTGNEVIDRQHKHLFEVINSLHDAMLAGHGVDVLQQTLNEIYQYTMAHFQTEESIMLSNDYPGYPEHKAMH
ncbi:bacteriohemerythrin [Prochlorothrix hollandica]|uniref:bacteriohemerythrin n=1 Tax=Prochlorothrix hollandica TaxID=1223 RepID=UPI00333E7E9F